MKIISFLTHTAVFSGGAFLLGLMFGSQAFGFFAAATSTSILLIVSQDYGPRFPALRNLNAARTPQTLPLAA